MRTLFLSHALDSQPPILTVTVTPNLNPNPYPNPNPTGGTNQSRLLVTLPRAAFALLDLLLILTKITTQNITSIDHFLAG